MPVKEDDIARGPSPRVAAEEARSGVRDKHAPGVGAELDVGPDFTLDVPMGETAYGQAYRAERVAAVRDEDREVAIHVLPIDDERDARELPLAFAKVGRLSHPHVVGLEAVGRARPDGPYYLVTQPLKGESLATLLEDAGTFDLVRALLLARQIAQVLRVAHKLQVVHGALSPANVRLMSREDVRVVGFGCAAFRPPPPPGTRAVRAPRPYEAPELTRGAVPDARADVFALGCLLFRMLTGRVPSVREGEPSPSLRASGAPSVPDELEALVAGCLALDPAQRIADTVVLIGRLRAILNNELGVDPNEGRSGESLIPPDEPGELLDEAEQDEDPETIDPDENSIIMMSNNRIGVLWILGGLLLVLGALLLLWGANTRS
ncbi:MAG: serine/threonine-protein kinase [Polyangiales bacterium]